MRIWCVSIVLTLTFNSLANSETLRPLPISVANIYIRELQDITQKFPISVRVAAVDDGMRTNDHDI